MGLLIVGWVKKKKKNFANSVTKVYKQTNRNVKEIFMDSNDDEVLSEDKFNFSNASKNGNAMYEI